MLGERSRTLTKVLSLVPFLDADTKYPKKVTLGRKGCLGHQFKGTAHHCRGYGSGAGGSQSRYIRGQEAERWCSAHFLFYPIQDSSAWDGAPHI